MRGLFGAVAPTYDLLNTLLSFGLHKGWRRAAADAAALPMDGRALDVATGTGDLALELQRRMGPGGMVAGADFCEPMLRLGVRKAKARTAPSSRPYLVLGDALALPFSDGGLDAATIAFGLRNTADYRRCLSEMARVLKPGGRLVVLEFALPRNPVFRAIYLLYFNHLLPAIGRLVHGRRESYQYLPESVKAFAGREELARAMEEADLEGVRQRDLTLGIVALHVGRKRCGARPEAKGDQEATNPPPSPATGA